MTKAITTITVLGSTGSVGVQALSVIADHPERYRVEALTAYQNHALLLEQCRHFRPRYALVVLPEAAERLRLALKSEGLGIEVFSGERALVELASDSGSQVVLAAIVGAAGLMPTFSAISAGKRVLFANKEVSVMAGALLPDRVLASGAMMVPVDSEHNALMQCLPGDVFSGSGALANSVESVTLTASGGPFLRTPLADLKSLTPKQAVAHPTWSMGQKISVDSATMMNKGLEVIEAQVLFGFAAEKIDVLIHPQSIVHALAHYHDGSVMAHLGMPDMRTPIAVALAWPERISTSVSRLDLKRLGELSFFGVCPKRYPCFFLARAALQAGGGMPCVLNAANEVAVSAFLAGKIAFTDIATVVDHSLDACAGSVGYIPGASLDTNLEVLLQLDFKAREIAQKRVATSQF